MLICVSLCFSQRANCCGKRACWRAGLSLRAGFLWRAGLSWRAGLPRVGLRSGPETRRHGSILKNAVVLLGLLRSPTRGKPARHNSPFCHDLPAGHRIAR